MLMKPISVHILVLTVLLMPVLVSIFSGSPGGHQATTAAWVLGILYVGAAYLGYAILASLVYMLVSRRTLLNPARVIGIHFGCLVAIYCTLYVYIEFL